MQKTDKEVLELCKAWFEDIMERCDKLTSGNVSHGSRAIHGTSKNYSEFVGEHLKSRLKPSEKEIKEDCKFNKKEYSVNNGLDLGCSVIWKDEEPASEDLEQAVNAYIGYAPEVDESSSTYGKRQAFKAGANWQKQQLVANAVDGFVIEDIEEGNGDFLLSAEYLSKDMGLKDRQKVKVIVIKDD